MISRTRASSPPRFNRHPPFRALDAPLRQATFPLTPPADVQHPGDRRLSLREAISRANATPAPDTIVLQAGIYRITIPHDLANFDANATGAFDILASATLRGAAARPTIIDAQHLDRVFALNGTGPSSIRVQFQNLTIRGGFASTSPGGGILAGNADLRLRDCVVTGNTGGHGG